MVSYFVFISSSDLMNDVSPLDVIDFTERKFIFPVLLCKNIKPFTRKTCACIDISFFVPLILEEVKVF